MGLREEIVEELMRLARELRGMGLSVGVDEVISAARIIESYVALRGDSPSSITTGQLYRPPLVYVLKSTMVKRPEHEIVFEKVISSRVAGRESRLVAQVEEALRKTGLRYGMHVSRGRRARAIENSADEYYALKKLGIIRRSRGGGEEVVDREEAARILRDALRRFSANSMKELAARVWESRMARMRTGRIREFKDLIFSGVSDTSYTEKLPTSKLMEIVRLSSKATAKARREYARRLYERIVRDGEVQASPKHIREVMRILDEQGLVDEKLVQAIASSVKSSIDFMVQDPKLLRYLEMVVQNLDPEVQGEVLKRMLVRGASREHLRAALEKVSPYALYRIESALRSSKVLNDEERRIAVAVSTLARSLRDYLRGLERGDPAYIYMADAELEEAERVGAEVPSGTTDISTLLISHYQQLRRLVGVLRGDISLLKELYRGDPVLTLRVLREAYRGTADENVKRRILSVAVRIASLAARRMRAKIEREKTTTRYRSGPLELRDTIYNIIRHREAPLRFRGRSYRARFILAIDVSGSMREYSEWTVLMASAFSRSLEALITFRDDVTVYSGRLLRDPRLVVEMIFGLEFGGWTNIHRALEHVLISHYKSRSVVVVTDLRQTVRDRPPSHAVSLLSKRGVRVYFIVPPMARESDVRDVQESGGQVVRVRRVEELPRALARILR